MLGGSSASAQQGLLPSNADPVPAGSTKNPGIVKGYKGGRAAPFLCVTPSRLNAMVGVVANHHRKWPVGVLANPRILLPTARKPATAMRRICLGGRTSLGAIAVGDGDRKQNESSCGRRGRLPRQCSLRPARTPAAAMIGSWASAKDLALYEAYRSHSQPIPPTSAQSPKSKR
jgi:hypothetical protein